MRGIVDHTDSLGNAGRYGHGDVQWMTAGSGIVHGEMFPLVHEDAPNHLRLFQIWLNLPSRSKMTEPAFVMHWAPDVQTARPGDGGVDVVVWAGSLFGAKGQPPPPDSWATDPANDVGIYFLTAFLRPPLVPRFLWVVEFVSIVVRWIVLWFGLLFLLGCNL